MTFDEANDIVVFAKDGTEIMMRSEQESWSDEDSRNATLKLVAELRKTYAPEIEMTHEQHDQLMAFRNLGSSFSTFMYKQGNHELSAFPEMLSVEREDELMLAWLHPKLIKAVD